MYRVFTSLLSLALIAMTAILIGCAATPPVQKSSNYTVKYITKEKMSGGKYVVIAPDKGIYKVHYIGDSFEKTKKDLGSGRSEGVLWIKDNIVSPYFVVPRVGWGQYDEDLKTFQCPGNPDKYSERDFTRPTPCLGPFTKFKSILDALPGDGYVELVLDVKEIIKSVEESNVFEILASHGSGQYGETHEFSFLKVKANNREARVLKVNEYEVKDTDEILKLEPGNYALELQCIRFPREHGNKKGKKLGNYVVELVAGYYYSAEYRGNDFNCETIIVSKSCRQSRSDYESGECEQE